jgi:hypothetical protein
VDDSATESETESDREYLGLPPLKQKAQSSAIKDNIVSAHTGKNRAVDGEELAPDSDPEGTKYVSVKVRSEVPTLTARFHQSSYHSTAIRRKRSFEGKALQLPAKRRHV